MTPRVELSRPLTPAEEQAVEYLAQGLTYAQVADALGISMRTAKYHIVNAGKKIPGDLPLQLRVKAWFRGAEVWSMPTDGDSV